MRGKEGSTIVTISIAVFLVLAVLSPICNSASEEGEEVAGTPAGWSDEINISEPTSRNHLNPSIAINEENIHVVWRYNTGPTRDILYRKSTDGGRSWGQKITLGNSTFAVTEPDIALYNENIHVVWCDYENYPKVYYRNSTDNGETWNPVRQMTPDGINCYGGNINVNNSNIHIIWYSEYEDVNGEIYYRRSLDGGNTWDNGQGVDEDRRITFSPGDVTSINMAQKGVNISVTWLDERDGDWDIYWMISKDNGYTWEDGLGTPNVGRKISDTPDDSIGHTIAVNGSRIHIAWCEMLWPGPEYTLNYRNSTDSGTTWNAPLLLTGPTPLIGNSNIDVSGDNVHIVWNDRRDDGTHEEIYYKNSTDGGISWYPDLRLTFNVTEWSACPKIAVHNDTRHIVWYDWYGSNQRDIIYKRYPDFPTDSYPPLLYHNPVTTANGRLQIPLFVNITENGSYGVDDVTIFYKNIGDATYSNTSMMFYNGTNWNGTWMGEIPKQNQAGLLPYYIHATDHSNNSNQTIEYLIDVYDWPWPNVTAISPINGANNVSAATPITITFSHPMNISSVENSFSYTNGTAEWTSANGSWSWDVSNTIGTFTPFILLQYYSQYFLRLNSSIVIEANGHHLDGNEDSEWTSPETWLPLKDMLGVGDRFFGSASLNGLLYAIGGNGGPPAVEVYNPANDSWYRVSSLNIGRESPTVSACNGKLYVIGGRNSGGSKVAVIEEYDPVLDKWAFKASLQKARYAHAAAVYEDKIYILGGLAVPGPTTASVEVYDTTLNITYEETNLTDTRRYFDAVTYSGKIYVAGGIQGATSIRTVESYDPVTKQWTSLSDMYHRRFGNQLNVLNDRLYAMGGEGTGVAANERYNPFTDEWTNVTRMPRGRANFGSGVVNERIYTYGGRLGPNYFTHDVYIPDDDFHSSFTTGEPVQVNITLDQGWNLVSLPLAQSDESINQVLSSIAGEWDYVQAYDPLAPEPWKTYATFKPGQLNDLQSLNHRMGFWINVTEQNVNLTVGGYVPTSTSINLYAGWNLVGYPTLNDTEMVGVAFFGTGADKVLVCDTSEPYHIKEVGPTYVMKPGEGYWVHVVADSVWVVDW